LGLHAHGAAEHAHPPLERRVDRVLAVREGQAEHVLHGTPDRGLVLEAGQLEAAAPAADHPGLGVADEEGRVRVRVVVVQQLEQKAESTLLAAAGRAAEAGSAFGRSAPRSTVGADEDRHWSEFRYPGRTRIRLRPPPPYRANTAV